MHRCTNKSMCRPFVHHFPSTLVSPFQIRMFGFFKKKKKDGTHQNYSVNPNIESIINNSMIKASHQTANKQIQVVVNGLDQLQVGDAGTGSSSYVPPDQAQVAAHNQLQVGDAGSGSSSYVPPDQAQVAAHNHGQSWISSTASIGHQTGFDKVCDFLQQSEVGMVGIYGMGGVGKTTLVKKVCNEFLKPSKFKVIWIVVSKTVDLDGIQKHIMRGLNLKFREEDDTQTRAMEINDALISHQGKVVILLDDIWEALELDEVGILGGNGLDTATYKIIFTTRSEDVCLQMHPDKKLKVECLGWDESWALFSRSVGEETLSSHYKIPDLAKEVAKECSGLPLALTIIGKAMVSKTSPGAWKDASLTLQKSPSKVLGAEKKLFERLKFSYDNLPNQVERDCFLFCCLFPEDEVMPRKDLVEYWIGEGLLDMDDGYQEACNRGDAVIDTILSKSLLEKEVSHRVDNGLKLHDVVRDMGLWIGSGLNLFVNCKGLKLNMEQTTERGMVAKRMYVLASRELPELVVPSNLSTMFIVGEYSSRCKISNSLLQSLHKMKLFSMNHVDYLEKQPSALGMLLGLRYLEIKGSNLTTLPAEIGNLTHLLVLKLVGNKSLTWLPATVGQLVVLRKLYIVNSGIRTLNSELEKLRNLEILVIDNYLNREITVIPSVIFQHLAQLRILRLRAIFNIRILSKKLWSLSKLEELDMIISRFNRVVESTSIDEVVEEGEIVTGLEQLSSLRNLRMEEWPIDKFLMPHSASSCLFHLNELHIFSCNRLETIHFDETHLQSLCYLSIHSCYSLNHVIGLQHLQHLQQLWIGYCPNLKGDNGSLLSDAPPVCFPQLKSLELEYLKISSICSDNISFPSLSKFTLCNSLCLKKLPRGLMNINKPLEGKIQGTEKWWEAIQWQDNEFKSSLSPLFRETSL